MGDEQLVGAALHAAFGAAVDPAVLEAGEAAVRAAAASHSGEPDALATVEPLRRRAGRRGAGRAAAAVLAAALTLGGPGLAAAANRSAPGDGLYDTKLLIERLWSAAAPGAAATARVHLQLAVRRVGELEALPQDADPGTRARLLGAAHGHLDDADRLDGHGLRGAITAIRARLTALTAAPAATPSAARTDQPPHPPGGASPPAPRAPTATAAPTPASVPAPTTRPVEPPGPARQENEGARHEEEEEEEHSDDLPPEPDLDAAADEDADEEDESDDDERGDED